METIFQSIEILSKEKGIDPQIVLDAVKDAMLIAARNSQDFPCCLRATASAAQLNSVQIEKSGLSSGRSRL